MKETEASVGGLDRFFRDVHHATAGQDGAVLGFEESRLLLGEEIVVALPDRGGAIDPQSLFLCPVPADEPQVLGILDEEHDRQVLEDRIEETSCILEFGRASGERLFGALMLGQFLLPLRKTGGGLLFQIVQLVSRWIGTAHHLGQPSPNRLSPGSGHRAQILYRFSFVRSVRL